MGPLGSSNLRTTGRAGPVGRFPLIWRPNPSHSSPPDSRRTLGLLDCTSGLDFPDWTCRLDFRILAGFFHVFADAFLLIFTCFLIAKVMRTRQFVFYANLNFHRVLRCFFEVFQESHRLQADKRCETIKRNQCKNP